MKRTLMMVMIVIIAFAFCSCKGGINREEAKSMTNEFFSAIEAKDYEKASELTHPDRIVSAERIEKFVAGIGDELNIDFTDIEIKRYTGFSSSYYSSDVDGSRYELEMNLIVNDVPLESKVEVVKNDSGYGIYNFTLDRG